MGGAPHYLGPPANGGRYANMLDAPPASVITVSSEAVLELGALRLATPPRPGPFSLSFSTALHGGADSPVLDAVSLV